MEYRMDDLTNRPECDLGVCKQRLGRSYRLTTEATKDFTIVPLDHIQDWQADIRKRFDFSGYKETKE